MMLFVGGGLIPPVFGVMAGIIGLRVRQKDLKASHQKL
jgi:cytochrome bd-type quinol oxidase subunit 2